MITGGVLTQSLLYEEPVLHVLTTFHKDEKGFLSGEVKTLLPSTTYEFSVYALNPMNYNLPSAYSLPVTTPAIEDTREFVFEAFSNHGVMANKGKFSPCTVRVNYQDRK